MAAFGTFERMLAVRYLRARRPEGFISVIAGFSLLGIALGVATLIIVMSVLNGLRQELLGRILGPEGHVTVQGESGPIADYDRIAERLRGLKGVVSAIPIVDGEVMATANGGASGTRVRGMRADDLAHGPLAGGSIRAGSLANVDEGSVIVGARLAQSLRIGVGDKLTLLLPQFQTHSAASLPRTRAFTHAATFSIGIYEHNYA